MIATPDLDPGTLAVVEWIWGLTLLIIVVAVVPIVLTLVYRLIGASWRIERYLAKTLAAAGGIAANTSNIKALTDTIGVAGPILEVAASIDSHCAAIENLLISRATAGK
ncbi:MAG: hypothetical protein M3Z07_03525 [Candidatus Eremiobacteraeota bacterium]|nr:hypothetical protein [Candidatus Eremiobacteraeota bacterium]